MTDENPDTESGRGSKAVVAAIAVLAAVTSANGLWMLCAPLHWYNNVPAGVPDYGPFNAHFVRDIGIAFLTVGAALGWAIVRPAARFELVAVAGLFAVLHGVLHVFDTARGHVASSHWLLDVPGVYLPAGVLCWLLWVLARKTES